MIRWPRFGRRKALRPRSAAERERALRRCLRCLVLGDGEAAEAEIVALVRADSRDVELYLLLGRMARDAGDVGRAIRIHQNLLLRADLDTDQRTEALCALGSDLRSGGFLQRAVASFEEARERTPRDVEVWRALAELYEEVGSFDEALTARERVLKSTGASRAERAREAARLWLAKGRAAHEAGREDEARRSLRKALSRDSGCVEARVLQGRLEAERGRSKQALSVWQSAVGANERVDGEVYPLIASAYAALGRSAEFEKWLRERLEREPADSGARAALARLLAERGDRSDAIAELRRLLEGDPDHLEARAQLGRWLLEEGRQDEAAAELAGWLAAYERGALSATEADRDPEAAS
ncbi:MAG: tetratricopeptide repeat protein [Myxococcota bacterium]